MFHLTHLSHQRVRIATTTELGKPIKNVAVWPGVPAELMRVRTQARLGGASIAEALAMVLPPPGG
jgi:hypothetical protein